MKFLIKSAKIIQKSSAFHLKTKDILIENGKIKKIADKIQEPKAQLVQGKNLMVSSGWVDTYAVLREPGKENKDRLSTLVESAALGGFTELLGISGSHPSISDRSQIEFIKNNTKESVVQIHPVGTITEKREGKDIAELYDMHLAGSIAFSDGKSHIKNPELLKRALLYVKPFGGKVMVYSEDSDLAEGGMVNEGAVTVGLGMKVRPAIAEEIALERNLQLASYTDSAIHLQSVSSENAVKSIKAAKQKGIKITSDVQVSSLIFNDQVLQNFDTNFKVLPVIRSSKDQKTLLKALKDGTIDCVASGHTPQDTESKECEFDHAEFGMMTLECAVAAFHKAFEKDFSLEEIVTLFADKPREIFGLSRPQIAEGEVANLTIFSLNAWEFQKKQIKSVSKNSPFIGQEFKLRVDAIVNKGQLHLNF